MLYRQSRLVLVGHEEIPAAQPTSKQPAPLAVRFRLDGGEEFYFLVEPRRQAAAAGKICSDAWGKRCGSSERRYRKSSRPSVTGDAGAGGADTRRWADVRPCEDQGFVSHHHLREA